MRFDVKTWPELDRAIHDYREEVTTAPLILVLHTPGEIAYRFIIGTHGIERQQCDRTGAVYE